MASLLKWWEVYSAKKTPNKTKRSSTRAATFLSGGTVANMYELSGNYRKWARTGIVVCTWCDFLFYLCRDFFFPLAITKALWKLSCNCSFFQVWQKAIKSVQKYARCGGVSLWGRRMKGIKGTSAASFITQAKGQGFITVAKGLLEICGEFSQVSYWLTAWQKLSWGLKAVCTWRILFHVPSSSSDILNASQLIVHLSPAD